MVRKTKVADCSMLLLLPNGSEARLGRGYVQDITLSPDGDLLAVASSFGLWLYSVSTPDPLTLLEPGVLIRAVAFASDGEQIATSTDNGTIKVWSVKNKSVLMELARAKGEHTTELVFSPDCHYLVAGGTSNRWNREEKRYCSVEVWTLPQNAKTDAAPIHIERDRIYSGMCPIAFSPDSRLIAFAVPESTPKPYRADGYSVIKSKWVLVCEITTGKHLTVLDGFNNVCSISFSPCGQFLAVGDFNAPIRVWEVPEGFSADMSPWYLHKVYQKEKYENTYQCVSYSPEGTLRAAVRSVDDYTIAVQEPEKSGTIYQHPNSSTHYCGYFQNATRFAIAGDFDVHLWTLEEKRSACVSQMHTFQPHSLNFSLDGKRLVAMHRSDGIFIWDVTLPDQPPYVFNVPIKGFDSYGTETYFSVDISPEDKPIFISGDENSIRLWELGIDAPITTIPTQEEMIDATFSPTDNLIACRGTNNQIYIWDVATQKLRDTYFRDDKTDLWPTVGLTFSSDGAYLAWGSNDFYDVHQCEYISKYASENVQFRSFSPDSLHFWDTAGANETIRLWNIHQGEVVLSLRKPDPEPWEAKYVEVFALSDCGQYLACSLNTLESKGKIFVWDIRRGDTPIATFKTVPGIISSLVFSSDRALLASGMEDGTILLWDLKPYLTNT